MQISQPELSKFVLGEISGEDEINESRITNWVWCSGERRKMCSQSPLKLSFSGLLGVCKKSQLQSTTCSFSEDSSTAKRL